MVSISFLVNQEHEEEDEVNMTQTLKTKINPFMKAKLVSPNPSTFNPIILQLTLESQKEIDILYSLFENEAVADTIKQIGDPECQTLPEDIYFALKTIKRESYCYSISAKLRNELDNL
jgi:hypothetical protein